MKRLFSGEFHQSKATLWLIVFVILGVAFLTLSGATLDSRQASNWLWLGLGLASLALATLFFLPRALKDLPDEEKVAELQKAGKIVDASQKNDYLYGEFLSFLGVLILILTLVCTVGLGGLLIQGKMSIPFVPTADHGPSTSEDAPAERATPTDRTAGGEQAPAAAPGGREGRAPREASRNPFTVAAAFTLILSMLLGLVGSVFFTANSLLEKWGKEDFSMSGFWSGFWFRIGESLLFVLVIFLILCSDWDGVYDRYINWLPALALLMGMFVKSGEWLIFGLAERLFEVARGILPPATAGAEAVPGRPRNLATTSAAAGKLELTWDEPLSGGRVEFYRIYWKPAGGAPIQQLNENPGSERRFTFDGTKTGEIHVKAGNASGEGEAATLPLKATDGGGESADG